MKKILSLLLLFSIAAHSAPPIRYHILLVTCLSDKETGQGHPQASTPHLDRLAKNGVLLTHLCRVAVESEDPKDSFRKLRFIFL